MSFRANPKWYVLACKISLITIFLNGCTLRSVDAEYYIGPVVFRYTAPTKGSAYVDQVMRFGIAAEAGTNWGLTLGMLERIAVAPLIAKNSDSMETNEPQAIPWSFFTVPLAEDWKLSLFYLCMGRHTDDYFIYRSIYGAELVAGEINNLSLGVVRRTVFKPPENAFSSLHFESSHPMQAQAKIWIDDNQHDNFSPELFEEISK